MLSLNSHLGTLLAACVGLGSSHAAAQTVATSFEELQPVLREGRTVIVIDDSGQRTKGKVADLSRSALVVLTPEARTFSQGGVTEIWATDPLLNGGLIGGAIGTGFAIWDYLIDPSEPGNGAVFAVAIGLGTAVGAGIDALVNRGKILYATRRQTRRVTVSPVVGRDRQGALVSVRF